jgi:putative ABC transport system permease protein
MLKNYLKIALRTLGKHKLYTVINVFGLAVGMACCVLIFMLVRHEWSFDTFHENAGDLYKVVIQETRPSGDLDYRLLMPPTMTPNLAASFPAIEGATRVVAGNVDLKRGDEIIRQRLMEADSSFFERFTFPVVAGDSRSLLRDPSAMVITEEAAQVLFDAAPGVYGPVLGEVLSIESGGTQYDFNVVAVAADLPKNSSLQFDAIISFENYANIRLGGNDWGGRTSTFIQLARGDDPAAFEASLRPFTATELAGRIEGRRNAEYLAEGEDAFKLILQPLRDLHLNPTIGTAYEAAPHDPTYSYVLVGIALLVLVIACINFMTLSIGRSTSRAREVGMRKVLGAQRVQLMKQSWEPVATSIWRPE